MDGTSSTITTVPFLQDGDPFLRHIILLLSVYELGTKSAPPPVWYGIRTWQTDAIIRAIVALGRRLWDAEEDIDKFRKDYPDLCPPPVERDDEERVGFPDAVPPLGFSELNYGYGGGGGGYFPNVDTLGMGGWQGQSQGQTQQGGGGGSGKSMKSINELFVVDHTFTPLGAAKEPPSTTKPSTTSTSTSTSTSTTTTTITTTSKSKFKSTTSTTGSKSSTTKPSPSSSKERNSTPTNTTRPSLSLGPLPSTMETGELYARLANLQPTTIAHAQAVASNNNSNGSTSAPPTAHACCPTCGKTISDPMVLPLYAGYGLINPNLTGAGLAGLTGVGGVMGNGNATGATGSGGGSNEGDPNGINSNGSSPMIVPSMGPLAHAAFESGMSAVEELKLLKAQVQDVARVCNAVARGDLSQKITVPVQGVVMVQLKDVINTMVDKLGQFAKEVTRVSQEVGTEGKLGGQALVLDVEGTWRELTGVVNKLAANLTSQVSWDMLYAIATS